MRSLEPALSFVGRAFAGGVALPGRVSRSGRFLSMGLVLVSELTDKSGTENAAAWGEGGGLGKTVDDIQWGAGGCLYSCCIQLRSQQRWRCASLLCEADLLEGVQEVKAASGGKSVSAAGHRPASSDTIIHGTDVLLILSID